MNLLKALLLVATALILGGCASTPSSTYKEGDYRLLSVSDNGRPFERRIVLKLSESNLAIAGVKNSWIAPIPNNQIGALTPVKRTESQQVGAIEAMFLNTIDGAEIATTPNGLVTFNRNGRVVAVFEAIE
jgi:hypothetical protein